jgi:hypothetical protein
MAEPLDRCCAVAPTTGWARYAAAENPPAASTPITTFVHKIFVIILDKFGVLAAPVSNENAAGPEVNLRLSSHSGI